jgi:hypothetical protein
VPNWLDSAFVIMIPDGLFERVMSLYPDKYGMNTRVSINIHSVCTEAHEWSRTRAALIFVWLIMRLNNLLDSASGSQIHIHWNHIYWRQFNI